MCKTGLLALLQDCVQAFSTVLLHASCTVFVMGLYRAASVRWWILASTLFCSHALIACFGSGHHISRSCEEILCRHVEHHYRMYEVVDRMLFVLTVGGAGAAQCLCVLGTSL